MNILFVRKVFIKKAHHINTEIQLIKALNSLGHNSKLVGLGDKNESGDELILLKYSFGQGRYFLFKLFFFLPFYCIFKKVDTVIIDNEIVSATFFLLLIKKIFSIKLLLDVRSIPVEQKLPDNYKRSCLVANKYFDGATFITEGTKNFVENLIHKKFKRAQIFPSAVNATVFSPVISNGVAVDIKEKIKNKVVLFYHGSISPNRGVNLLLDSLNEIKNTFPNILFMSLSGGNDYIKKYCGQKNYNLENHLLLLNVVDHEKVPSYIKLADICIVPLPRILWWEISSPLKLMEYLAMEKPLILSNIKAHQSVVPSDSDYAVYFDPDDPKDLTDKTVEAIQKIDRLKFNALKGRELVLNKFTWNIQAKVIEEFIARL